MESNRIDSNTFKSYNAIVGHYLNETTKNEAWMPSTLSETSLNALIDEKKSYSSSSRKVLVDVITKQYQSCGIDVDSDKSLKQQLLLLSQDNSYTVTTGHQLCMFSGPLYFMIKVLQTIKLANVLSEKDDAHHIIPIFWLASEDHDFPEANHVHLFGKKLLWDDEQGGKLGAYSTESMSGVMDEILQIMGMSEHAVILKEIFKKAYGSGLNLSQATRILLHRLFGQKGIVVLDGDDPELKNLFKDYMKEEILEKRLFQHVTTTNASISPSYKVKVNPREINLFYLGDQSRSRIKKEGQGYKTVDGKMTWTHDEMLIELDTHPENFSPNVILRPLYQEVILPNLCYVGGPGELAYWLQLKSTFESWNVAFPGLNLRNSFLWLDQNTQKKLNKLNLSAADLFLEESKINERLINFDEHAEDITQEFKTVSSAFDNIAQLIMDVDPTLKPYILAEGRKSEKILEQMKKRIIKAKKDKNREAIDTYWKIIEKLFPNGSLHERYDNFVPYFLKHGWSFFDEIYDQIDPFDDRLCVIRA